MLSASGRHLGGCLQRCQQLTTPNFAPKAGPRLQIGRMSSACGLGSWPTRSTEKFSIRKLAQQSCRSPLPTRSEEQDSSIYACRTHTQAQGNGPRNAVCPLQFSSCCDGPMWGRRRQQRAVMHPQLQKRQCCKSTMPSLSNLRSFLQRELRPPHAKDDEHGKSAALVYG